jgi:hypothetical protein
MSHELDKIKNSKRRQKDENAVNKQVKIAKGYGVKVEEPHKFAKHHALNCGDPKCSLCSNPRHSGYTKGQDRLTAQERKLFQDLDHIPDKHSNGLKPPEE